MRLVLDTNVWLDWLVFDDISVSRLKDQVAKKNAEIVIDDACLAELERVLDYPLKRSIDRAACLSQVRQKATLENFPAATALLPRCSDPDDQKFLELAAAARADALVTKDRSLLDLAKRKARPLPFRVCLPAALGDGGTAPGTPTRRSPRT